MPTMINRPCSQPGCPGIAVQGRSRCQVHAVDQVRYYDAQRGTPSQRGYDYAWRKVRKAFLAEHPMCEWAGCMMAASDVHHRITLQAGGSHDVDNLMALCHVHHSSVTAKTRPWGKAR